MYIYICNDICIYVRMWDDMYILWVNYLLAFSISVAMFKHRKISARQIWVCLKMAFVPNTCNFIKEMMMKQWNRGPWAKIWSNYSCVQCETNHLMRIQYRSKLQNGSEIPPKTHWHIQGTNTPNQLLLPWTSLIQFWHYNQNWT